MFAETTAESRAHHTDAAACSRSFNVSVKEAQQRCVRIHVIGRHTSDFSIYCQLPDYYVHVRASAEQGGIVVCSYFDAFECVDVDVYSALDV